MQYTTRHSDLAGESEPEPQVAASDTDSDSTSQSDTGGSDDDVAPAGEDTSLSKFERKKRKQLSAQRQIRAVALLDGLEEETYGPVTTPQTPQDRVKRRREWKWTLGSIENRNETFGFPPTPTKPTFSSLSGQEREGRSSEMDESCPEKLPDQNPSQPRDDTSDDSKTTIQ